MRLWTCRKDRLRNEWNEYGTCRILNGHLHGAVTKRRTDYAWKPQKAMLFRKSVSNEQKGTFLSFVLKWLILFNNAELLVILKKKMFLT